MFSQLVLKITKPTTSKNKYPNDLTKYDGQSRRATLKTEGSTLAYPTKRSNLKPFSCYESPERKMVSALINAATRDKLYHLK
jgi:hypothetical protein